MMGSWTILNKPCYEAQPQFMVDALKLIFNEELGIFLKLKKNLKMKLEI